MVADGATFPMCTVKNRLQVAGAAASKAAGRPAYSGAADCLVTIVRAGGPTCPSPLLYPSPLRPPSTPVRSALRPRDAPRRRRRQMRTEGWRALFRGGSTVLPVAPAQALYMGGYQARTAADGPPSQ